MNQLVNNTKILAKIKFKHQLLVFLLFFVSDDAFLFSTYPSLSLLITKITLYVVVFVFLLFEKCINPQGFLRGLMAVAGLSLFLAFSMAWNTDVSLNFAYRLFIFLLCLLFASRIRFEDYARVFVNVLFGFSVVAIVMWCILWVFPSLATMFPLLENSKGVSFPTIFFCSFLSDSLRAISIFREPGMFALYLIGGLLLEFFYFPEFSKKRVLVFSAGIIFTFSTLGFVCVLISYTLAGLMTQRGGEWLKRNWWIFLVGIGGGWILFGNEYVYSQMFSRNFGGDDLQESAAFSRVSSFTVPALIAFEHPLFGVGITPFLDFQESAGFKLYGIVLEDGNGTNTIMIEAAKHGILYGFFLLLFLYRLACRINTYGMVRLGTLFILLAMFSSQCMPYSVLYNLLLMYGVTYVGNKWL